MNKALESGTLADKFKQALKAGKNCAIEIRTPLGNPAGQRLHKALKLARVETSLVDVVATPHAGILIETNQQCAKTGLSIQSAFSAVGMDAHLLVQNTYRENIVIIHLNSDAEAQKAPKK
jgi:hypothetical protein